MHRIGGAKNAVFNFYHGQLCNKVISKKISDGQMRMEGWTCTFRNSGHSCVMCGLCILESQIFEGEKNRKKESAVKQWQKLFF